VRAWLEWIDSWYTLQFFSKLVEGAYVHRFARREPRRLPACLSVCMYVCVSVYSDSVMVWEKDGEPVQGLDVSRWSEKRVQVDFSNRLVFYSLKKQDEGLYRCIVDLELAAMYRLHGLSVRLSVCQPSILQHWRRGKQCLLSEEIRRLTPMLWLSPAGRLKSVATRYIRLKNF